MSPQVAAQTIKSTKACRVEYRKNQAAIRKAKEKRRDFLTACRKTPVGEETPIGDAAAIPAAAPPAEPPATPPPAPAPEAAAPEPTPPPAVAPAPADQPAPDNAPPPSAEPATSTAPEAPKPAEAAPQADAKDNSASPPADVEPAEDHSLPRWWNWTMWLSAAAVLVAAGFFAVRGLVRIRKAGG